MILDVNCYGIFINQKSEDMKLILNWLNKKGGKLVYSSHKAIQQNIKGSKIGKFLFEYSRAGKVKQVPKEKVSKSMDEISRRHQLKSDDLPILGLALAGEATLLCSNDKRLHSDFGKIIPDGKVYQTKKHKHLLQNDVCP